MHNALAVSIPSPRAEQDSVIRATIAPLVARLHGAAELEAVSFERFNKPDWGILLRVLGAPAWLDRVARPEVERQLTAAGTSFTLVEAEGDDKWVGSRGDEDLLEGIGHADTLACLALMEAEARGLLATTSRAQWSLLAVESMLDLFGLDDDDRGTFYRRGWEWALESGRWDAEVFAVLDGKYAAQEAILREAISLREGLAWGGPVPERIARTLIDALRAPIGAIRDAVASGTTSKSATDLAVIVGHAHSNRLGIHATQEATIRYLVWRARGGRRPPTSSPASTASS